MQSINLSKYAYIKTGGKASHEDPPPSKTVINSKFIIYIITTLSFDCKYIKKKNKFQLFFNESYDCLAEIFLFNRFLQI